MTLAELYPLVDETDMRLLVTRIDREHRNVQESMENTLEHMIACGELLTSARCRIPRGEWVAWCNENLNIHRKTVSMYIRFALYADVLRGQGVSTSWGARQLLADMDIPRANSSESFALEAQRMRSQGISVADIAEHFEVSHARVSQWTNREKSLESARKAQARRAKAMALLRDDENARSVSKSGKELSEAYALVRRALQRLDEIEPSRHVSSAIRSLHAAEDHIVKASKESV